MMNYLAKIVLSVLLALCCSIPGFGQDNTLKPPPKRKFKHHERIDTTYDKTKDETLVRLDRMEISDDGGRQSYLRATMLMTVFFTYPGKVPRAPQSVVIAFLSVGKGVFSKDRNLTIYADNARYDMGKMDLIEKQIFIERKREILSLPMTYEMLLRIANARSVRLEIGPTIWNLGEDHLEALRDTASRVN